EHGARKALFRAAHGVRSARGRLRASVHVAGSERPGRAQSRVARTGPALASTPAARQPATQPTENRMHRLVVLVLILCGCAAHLPPPPGDAEAKRFEAVPDKSVIYVVRQPVDSDEGRTLTLDNSATITTWKGTFYRWETTPGTHRIAAFAGGS